MVTHRLPTPLVVIGVAVAAMVVTVVLASWVALPMELPPAGTGCDYAHNPDSGPSGSGIERVDWGLLPERVCVSDGRVYRDDAVFGVQNHFAWDFFVGVGVVAAGVIAGVHGPGAAQPVPARRGLSGTGSLKRGTSAPLCQEGGLGVGSGGRLVGRLACRCDQLAPRC